MPLHGSSDTITIDTITPSETVHGAKAEPEQRPVEQTQTTSQTLSLGEQILKMKDTVVKTDTTVGQIAEIRGKLCSSCIHLDTKALTHIISDINNSYTETHDINMVAEDIAKNDPGRFHNAIEISDGRINYHRLLHGWGVCKAYEAYVPPGETFKCAPNATCPTSFAVEVPQPDGTVQVLMTDVEPQWLPKDADTEKYVRGLRDEVLTLAANANKQTR